MQNSKSGKLLVFILRDVAMMGSDEQGISGGYTCEGESEIAFRPNADMIPVVSEKEARLRSPCSSSRVSARLRLSSPQSPSRGTGSYRVCLAFLPLQKPWSLWRGAGTLRVTSLPSVT